ncbi:MAG: DUF6528 family protein [Cyclobacteriaceae bacterium]|jgi:hypothetical protein|nr:DUF6528 family protein [Cyclobacteriaceae bacterium]
MQIRYVTLLLLLTSCFHGRAQQIRTSFLVCGDHQVLLVDYNQSRDSIPKVVWTWDAHHANDLPEEYRLKKFNTVDDCKPVKNGDDILVSSSSGAVAIVERKNGKVKFYAPVPNAHSIELLPGNFLAAAASTADKGNSIMVFDLAKGREPIFTDSLYSAHGLVWDNRRRSLYALGYDVLREYKLAPEGQLQLKAHWTIPGIGGHDLQPTPDGKSLLVTEHEGAWKFDIDTQRFSKIEGFPDAENIKSLGQNKNGQYIFTVPEERWWTFHVDFFNPARRFAFPEMKVYKARWFSR